jgi:hypothetical protein
MSKNQTRREFLKSAGAFGLSYALGGMWAVHNRDTRDTGPAEMILKPMAAMQRK